MRECVLFVERSAHAGVAGAAPPGTTVVALTAEAVDALSRGGIRHVPIATLVNTRALSQYETTFNEWAVDLAGEIEDFVLARHAEAPAGFLLDQTYSLQYAVGGIAWRTLLARDAIGALEAECVLVPHGDVDPNFAAEGYTEEPWVVALRHAAALDGFEVATLPFTNREGQVISRSLAPWREQLRTLTHHAVRIRDGVRGLRGTPLDELAGYCVLAADPGYDWSAVFRSDAGRRILRLHSLVGRSLDGREWTRAYDPTVYASGRTIDLGGLPMAIDPDEAALLRTLVSEWARTAANRISLLGIDLLPALLPLLSSHAEVGPALARYADALSLRALEAVKPDVVCFWAMPWLSSARLASRSREHGIPVLCYQHGGSYGTHLLTKEIHELRLPDYFLTYGEGICRQSSRPDRPLARFMPVGSTRIEAMRQRARPRRQPRKKPRSALWISEFSSQNVVGAWFAVEDTERYELETRCITLLASRLRVTYRPFPGQWQVLGVPDWLSRSRIQVRIDQTTPLKRLLHKTDIVVTDTSSSTIWNEVLALDVPLVLYCDPRQTPLVDAFAQDLEQACWWCRTPEELTHAVRWLADDPHDFLAEVRTRSSERFLERYVLQRDDGHCVDRALQTLADAVGAAREGGRDGVPPGCHARSSSPSTICARADAVIPAAPHGRGPSTEQRPGKA